MTPAEWRRVLDVDLYGVLHGTLAAYPIMVKQGSGHIINTSSATGLLPQPINAPTARPSTPSSGCHFHCAWRAPTSG